MQNRYSYLQPRPGTALPEGGHVHAAPTDLDYAAATPGMAVLTYSSLLSGVYTNPAKPPGEHYAHPGTEAGPSTRSPRRRVRRATKWCWRG
jgi:hypothetical protein